MLSLEKASRHGLKTPTCARWPALISWLAPMAPIAATMRNTLYPHLQARACCTRTANPILAVAAIMRNRLAS